jgi:hypothetical protein
MGQAGDTHTESLPNLVYYSDYFSFVGRDDQGHVAFSIDNNRGKDGEKYQAEHFLILHDEREGWVELLGNGKYENKNNELVTIPDSPFFEFGGSPNKGFVIKSRENDLTFATEPIILRVSRRSDEGLYEMGSCGAVLKWKGRTIKGRVIYEYLYKPGFNRLARISLGTLKNFRGLYLMVDSTGDMYFHHRGGKPSSITLPRDGFLVLNGKSEVLPFSEVKVTRSRQAMGFYRWPLAWKGKISLGSKSASAVIETRDFKVINGWIIGGFAMGIVHGTLEVDGKEYALYGFSELIM